MKNRFINKIIVSAMCCSLLGGTLVWNHADYIWAASTEENIELSEETTTEEASTEEPEDAQETGEDVVANSWRFQNGELIVNEGSSRATYPDAWNKVNGHYMNNKGEVIPGAVKKGIDVSSWNETIDWEKVKADGIDYAIIRCGYGMDYVSQDDAQWNRNVAECERLGIPYGVYLYSYADTVERASKEADHVLRLLKGHNPSYPVYYDLEDNTIAGLSAELKGQIAKTFCDKIEAAGYKVGIYSNLNWWNNYLTDPVFHNSGWSKWVAQYNSTCDYKGNYDMWQCTSTGRVNGISGNSGNVDINFWIMQEADEKDGVVVQDKATGQWCVKKNGQIDTNYTGVAQNENGWWYIKNGYLDWNYTGVAQNENGWWYIKNGCLDWNYTGVAQNENGWWYIKNGYLDWSYTGVAQNENGWWYIRDGYLDWNYTGVAQNENGWWYIRDGYLDWNYTGVGENENGWWYISGGYLDWNYSGNVQYKGNTYYVDKGYVRH